MNASTQTNARARNSAKAPNPGQPMLCLYEISHGIHNTVGQIGVKDDVRTHTTGGPSKELGQEVDWNIIGPFHWSPEWLR